jgi:hypothetical protein
MSRHTFGFAVRALIFFLFSQAAPVAILLSAHSLVSDIRSVLGGCSRFKLTWIVLDRRERRRINGFYNNAIRWEYRIC